MTEWRKVKLGDVSCYVNDKIDIASFDNSLYISTDSMLSDKGGITAPESIPTTGKVTKYQFEDILVSNIRPYFKKIWKSNRDGGCSNDVLVFRRNPTMILPTFLYYVLSCDSFFEHMMAGANGTKMPRGNKKLILNYTFGLPDLETQRRIAEVLSRYDALIENYQRQIKLLEEAAQRLYKEWFVDLRFPGHQSTPIINNLPQGWEKKKITDILDIKYGKDHKKLKDGPIPVYGTGGIMRYANSSLYCGESVLIPRKGSLNNIMLVNGSFWTIDTMFYSVPKTENAAKIAYFYLKDLDMYSFNIGAAVPSMTVNILSGMEISLPTDEIRHEFECRVDKYYQQIALLENQIRNLSEARDRLLPKLMSAEIDV